MKKPSTSTPLPQGAPADAAHEQWLQSFQTFLHTAITAHQTGCQDRLAALPGPSMTDYCRALADLPGNALALELAVPIQAILEQITRTVWKFRPPRDGEKAMDAPTQTRHARIQEQLDFALALILRSLREFVLLRADDTTCSDLLLEAALLAIGDGMDAARLIQHYQAMHPDDGRAEDGSLTASTLPDQFAWDAYQRIDQLDRLAAAFPDHIRLAARNMHAWPMLVHRHTNNRRRFRELATRLELGADYPLEAGEGARFRPDTPLVHYLDPLLFRLHALRCEIGDGKFSSVEEEDELIDRFWRQWPDDRPGPEVLSALRAARRLPPLTKSTAHQWATKALVPLILTTDARDPAQCLEPVLQGIWRQKGVKSTATFKSRLLAAVSATLRRLAREP